MKDLGIAVGQKWVTRSGRVVIVVLDQKDHQPFRTDAGTWHFKDGRMWEQKISGGDLINLLDEYQKDKFWRKIIDAINKAVAACTWKN